MLDSLRTRLVWVVLLATALLTSVATADPLKVDLQSFVLNFAGGTPTTSGLYDAEDTYDPPGPKTDGTANTAPVHVEYIRGFTQSFFDVLADEYKVADGWSYASAVNELTDDSLLVRTYDVQGTPGRVGVEFHLEYIGGVGDPTTNLHWIQVIKNNHAITDAGGDQGHGTEEFEVDNPFSPGERSPYYDDGGAAVTGAGTGDFYDFPGRIDTANDHNWIAELMLVSGPGLNANNTPNPGLITFYGGVRWGFTNTAIPEPATLVLAAMGGVGLITRRRRAA